jgi:CheY-like chemotaxis protein
MDIKLGYDMNGIQAASEIRKLPGYEKIPMVAVTAYAMQFDKDFFLSQGFNYYLSKPYSKNDLLKLTYQILSSS